MANRPLNPSPGSSLASRFPGAPRVLMPLCFTCLDLFLFRISFPQRLPAHVHSPSITPSGWHFLQEGFPNPARSTFRAPLSVSCSRVSYRPGRPLL